MCLDLRGALILSALAMSTATALRVLITGTSRGIGLGLTKALLAHPSVASVVATCRNPEGSTALQDLKCDKLTLIQLDVTDAASQQQLSQQLSVLGMDSIDVLIANHGISNPAHPVEPILSASAADMLSCFNTNCVGTLMTLQQQTPRLAKSQAKLCVMLSSRLASIEQCNGLGGYTSYRASKAAVNMLAATYVNDPDVRGAGVKCLLLHPGWVQTDMGGSGGRTAPVSVDQSVAGLVVQIFRGCEVQRSASPASAYAEGSFERILAQDRLVFAGFDGELLPF